MAGRRSIERSAATPVETPSDFDAFYAQSFDRATRLAFLLTSDSSGAEDIAQEALSRMQPAFGRIEEPSSYLRTVVVNLCKRLGSDRARQRATRQRLGPPTAVTTAPFELMDVIGGLPRRQRAVIVLRYYEDLSEAEIASILNCRAGTVKSLASRALATLRKELER